MSDAPPRRMEPVRRLGPLAQLGCDFCGTYGRPVGVVAIPVWGQPWPMAACLACARNLVGQITVALEGKP